MENALPILTKAISLERPLFYKFILDDRSKRLIMDGLFSKSVIIQKAYCENL